MSRGNGIITSGFPGQFLAWVQKDTCILIDYKHLLLIDVQWENYQMSINTSTIRDY